MDSQQKEIMSNLLEKLIEDVVTKAQNKQPDYSPSSVVYAFVEKVSRYIKLSENEKETLHRILDDFIDEVCARLKKAHSGAINVSDLIHEYVANISERFKFQTHERSSFSVLLRKLTNALIDELGPEDSEEEPTSTDDAEIKSTSPTEVSENKSTTPTEAREIKPTPSTEAAEKKAPPTEVSEKKLITSTVVAEKRSTTSLEDGTCATECVEEGYERPTESGDRLTKGPLCSDEECMKEEDEGGGEEDERGEKGKDSEKMAQHTEFLQEVIDKVLALVLDEIHSRRPLSPVSSETYHPPSEKYRPPSEKDSEPPRSKEKEERPARVISKKPPSRAERESYIPSGRERCFNFRRWGVTMLLFYLMLLPFTLLLGAIFGQAVCHGRPCANDWPQILWLQNAPMKDDSCPNACAPF